MRPCIRTSSSVWKKRNARTSIWRAKGEICPDTRIFPLTGRKASGNLNDRKLDLIADPPTCLPSGGNDMGTSSDGKQSPFSTISRRQLLQLGGLGLLNMGLPGTVAARVDATPGRGKGAADKSCIFILLCG